MPFAALSFRKGPTGPNPNRERGRRVHQSGCSLWRPDPHPDG